MWASHATSITPIFLPYQQLYSAFFFFHTKESSCRSFIDKICKRDKQTSFSRDQCRTSRQRSSENYFSKLHQNVISIERMLAPSHCLCLSLFSFIRNLLVSEPKARGLFRRRRSRSRRLRRVAAAPSSSVVVLSFECHSDTHSSHIIARTTHCFAFLVPVPRASLSSWL